MRLLAIIACLVASFGFGLAAARTDHTNDSSPTTGVSGGRTPPEERGQAQPQGWTGPINTQSGGAPPESPQGQSPPGMQAAPDGSTKTVVAPDE